MPTYSAPTAMSRRMDRALQAPRISKEVFLEWKSNNRTRASCRRIRILCRTSCRWARCLSSTRDRKSISWRRHRNTLRKNSFRKSSPCQLHKMTYYLVMKCQPTEASSAPIRKCSTGKKVCFLTSRSSWSSTPCGACPYRTCLCPSRFSSQGQQYSGLSTCGHLRRNSYGKLPRQTITLNV